MQNPFYGMRPLPPVDVLAAESRARTERKRLRGIWRKIVSRCTDKNNQQYKDYGGRGITISNEWLMSFDEFASDIGPRPSMDHSVDRIDNSLGYCKSNCRWATPEQQSTNRRSTKFFLYCDEKLSMSQICRRLGLKVANVNAKLRAGAHPAVAFGTNGVSSDRTQY